MYSGKTLVGDGRGKKMGFPTLNISMPHHPKCTGVFVVSVTIDTKKYFGLLHLGPRPTFQSLEYRIEIFLLQFHGSVSLNTVVEFSILKKIRDVIVFNSQEDLIEQIKKDRIFANIFLQTL